MLKFRVLCLFALLGTWGGSLRASDAWLKLKLGMPNAEVETALGSPLLRSEGRGFEIWTYDYGAEVVFYGQVVAWTGPANSPAAKSVMGEWQFAQGVAVVDRITLPIPPRRLTKAQREAQALEAQIRQAQQAENYGLRFRPR